MVLFHFTLDHHVIDVHIYHFFDLVPEHSSDHLQISSSAFFRLKGMVG